MDIGQRAFEIFASQKFLTKTIWTSPSRSPTKISYRFTQSQLDQAIV